MPLAEFGERIFFFPNDHKQRPMQKMEAKLREGVFVGVDARSNAYKVISDEGLELVRTIKRRLFVERWCEGPRPSTGCASGPGSAAPMTTDAAGSGARRARLAPVWVAAFSALSMASKSKVTEEGGGRLVGSGARLPGPLWPPMEKGLPAEGVGAFAPGPAVGSDAPAGRREREIPTT